MVVSPCTTFTLPEKVASFFLSRISSDAASIWIGWSRFCEKPCIAFGTPDTAPCARAPPRSDQRERERRCRQTARGKLHHEIHFVLADLPVTDRVFGGGVGLGMALGAYP